MSACSQCGTVVKPADKFCNICGSPIARATAPPPGAPGYGPAGLSPTFASQGAAPPDPYAPTPGGGYAPQFPGGGGPGAGGPGGSVPPARCQLGHDIAPGASYCALGHPIALDQMQFSNDPYGGAGYGQPPQPAYGAPRQPQAPYPPPQSPGYGGQPSPPNYAPQQPNQAAYASAFGAPAGQAGYAPVQQSPPAYSPQPPPQAPQAPPQAQPQSPLQSPYAPSVAPMPMAPQASFGEPGRDGPPPRVLRGFLIAYGTNASGDFWPLTAGRHTVGRFGTGDGLDVPLQDPTISSRHAALVVDGTNSSVSVEDTGSTNGTFVNDEHIGYGGRRELRDGDRLRFGGFTTIVKVIGRV